MNPKIKKSFPLPKVYTLLESGPVILVTTARHGRPNVMTLAWHTMIDFNPPLVGLVMGEHNHSFATLRSTRECVLNIPSVNIAQAVMDCGHISGAKIDKFKAFGLTPLPARNIAAPLIAECPFNLECRVIDSRMVPKYNLFILEVVQAWASPGAKSLQTLHHLGGERFMTAGPILRLRSKTP